MRVQVAARIPLPVCSHFAIARVMRLCESAAFCCVSWLSGGRTSALDLLPVLYVFSRHAPFLILRVLGIVHRVPFISSLHAALRDDLVSRRLTVRSLARIARRLCGGSCHTAPPPCRCLPLRARAHSLCGLRCGLWPAFIFFSISFPSIAFRYRERVSWPPTPSSPGVVQCSSWLNVVLVIVVLALDAQDIFLFFSIVSSAIPFSYREHPFARHSPLARALSPRWNRAGIAPIQGLAEMGSAWGTVRRREGQGVVSGVAGGLRALVRNAGREGTRTSWKHAATVTCQRRPGWTAMRADAEMRYISPARRKEVRGELHVPAERSAAGMEGNPRTADGGGGGPERKLRVGETTRMKATGYVPALAACLLSELRSRSPIKNPYDRDTASPRATAGDGDEPVPVHVCPFPSAAHIRHDAPPPTAPHCHRFGFRSCSRRSSPRSTDKPSSVRAPSPARAFIPPPSPTPRTSRPTSTTPICSPPHRLHRRGPCLSPLPTTADKSSANASHMLRDFPSAAPTSTRRHRRTCPTPRRRTFFLSPTSSSLLTLLAPPAAEYRKPEKHVPHHRDLTCAIDDGARELHDILLSRPLTHHVHR
ncbi:hypothetical protein DFH09DRAFT_1374116 [Mycena vulgaris]|nr:hypothetical protein DFH09DRAFT_1374116 [Mycena vulgaris]